MMRTRFWGVIAALAACVWLSSKGPMQWFGPVIIAIMPIAIGAVFYGYLLWEINGPILRAVDKYLKEQSTEQQPGIDGEPQVTDDAGAERPRTRKL